MKELFADGMTDDSEALAAMLRGEDILYRGRLITAEEYTVDDNGANVRIDGDVSKDRFITLDTSGIDTRHGDVTGGTEGGEARVERATNTLAARQRKAAMILHMALLKPANIDRIKKALEPTASGYDINSVMKEVAEDAVRELAGKG